MSWAISNEEYNFAILSSEEGIKLYYPLSKKISSHPTFLLAAISVEELLSIFNHRGVLDLPTSSPVAFAAVVLVSRALLFFPPGHFSRGGR